MKKRKNNTLGSFPIDEYSQNFNQIGFGCDYLRLCFNNPIDKFDYWLGNLDFDNSNFGITNIDGIDITYQKKPTPIGNALHFSVSYSGVSVPVFQYVKLNKYTKDLIGYDGKLDFYASYYRLVDLLFFNSDFFKYFVKTFTSEDPVVTRYDFRIDFFNKYKRVDIECPESLLSLHKKSLTTSWKEGGKYIDWSVGSKNAKRYLIRLYDKKVDTNKKGKWILFADYLCFESVHRLEYQFESAFCRGFHLSDLIKLEDKIYTCLNLHDNFNGCQFYKYDSDKEINVYNKGSHIQRFKNQTNKFIKAGYNPFKLMYDTIIDLYGIESAEDMFTDFLETYDFKRKNEKKI